MTTLEAKRAYTVPMMAQNQGKHYSKYLGVAFGFLSNGEEVRLQDRETGYLRAHGIFRMIVADNETTVDLLYYEAIARTVARLVSEKFDEPLSVGVHGDWGAGKRRTPHNARVLLA